MLFNNMFYPTPEGIGKIAISKVKGNPLEVLDPEAGKGDFLDLFKEIKRHYLQRSTNFCAIEIDQELQACLRGKGYTVLDDDFLTFNGPDKFDLILMNPPFDQGDRHLLKAFDVLYSGQIICLLNAETIKNPSTNTRKMLVRKLEEVGAEIEFHQDTFVNAERKTEVEVALINIIIERQIEEDLFAGVDEAMNPEFSEIEGCTEISTGKRIPELVAEYDRVIRIATETIIGYYRNFRHVGKYVGLNREAGKEYSTTELTRIVKDEVNGTIRRIRRDFWNRTLDLPEVRRRMTQKRLKEFQQCVSDRSHMDFTEKNIYAFIVNLIQSYDDVLTRAVLEVFDRFTLQGCFDDGVITDNIHYFNGWKTNKAFRVGKKVILRLYGGHGNGPFLDWHDKNQWRLAYDVERELMDIDIVMNYFDGCPHYTSITQALDQAFSKGENKNIRSTYFILTAHKKGTLHLTFNDPDILRRFNVAACRGKGWLPMDYGQKTYEEMSPEEKDVANTFEVNGKTEYSKHVGQIVYEHAKQQILMLAA